MIANNIIFNGFPAQVLFIQFRSVFVECCLILLTNILSTSAPSNRVESGSVAVENDDGNRPCNFGNSTTSNIYNIVEDGRRHTAKGAAQDNLNARFNLKSSVVIQSINVWWESHGI